MFSPDADKIPGCLRTSLLCIVLLQKAESRPSCWHDERIEHWLEGSSFCFVSLRSCWGLYLMCKGRETATMCATLCSCGRSSATKQRLNWAFLSHPKDSWGFQVAEHREEPQGIARSLFCFHICTLVKWGRSSCREKLIIYAWLKAFEGFSSVLYQLGGCGWRNTLFTCLRPFFFSVFFTDKISKP